jgi:osmotically-inducible protein OsmY
MNAKRILAWSLAAGLLLLPVKASADSPDTWITTKAKIALLTTDGVSGKAVNVDTVDGKVTLHGKVSSEGEKTKAEQTVRKLDGVKDVKNLLQVVPESQRKAVKANDSEIKKAVEAALEANPSFKDVKVQSVNQGVVLLAGKTASLEQKLKAIEAAYDVAGVRRVATEIEAADMK